MDAIGLLMAAGSQSANGIEIFADSIAQQCTVTTTSGIDLTINFTKPINAIMLWYLSNFGNLLSTDPTMLAPGISIQTSEMSSNNTYLNPVFTKGGTQLTLQYRRTSGSYSASHKISILGIKF